MNDIQLTNYGTDEYMQAKSFQVIGDRVKLNWNQNFDMDVYKFAECCTNMKNTPLSHDSDVKEVTVGAESDNIITMSKTFKTGDSKTEYLAVKSGEYEQTGNQAMFSIEELNNILGVISQLQ